jgi:hypothetical protein
MHTSGGRVSTVIGGVAYSARGEIKLDPSNMTVAAGVNQDGTVYRTVGAKVRTAEISFDRFVDNNRFPMKWDESVLQQVNLGFTFIEQDTGVTHLLSGGFFTGSPQENTSTGEISGLGIAAQKYETI